MADLIARLRTAADALPPAAPKPPHPLYGLIHEAAHELARLEVQIARQAHTHQPSPIVRMLQELAETWSDVKHDGQHYGVTIYFDCQEDANDFTVELMMAASGQLGYEKADMMPRAPR